MKNIFVLVLSVIILASCGSDKSNEKSTESTSATTDTQLQQDTKPDGDKILSTYANGKPKVVKTFKVDGTDRQAIYEKEYYEDGNLLKEGNIKNGKRDGKWKSYRRDGILWSEGDYVDGTRDGITITYHPNGHKYYEGQYTKGIKSGVWKFYDSNGTLLKEENFDKKK